MKAILARLMPLAVTAACAAAPFATVAQSTFAQAQLNRPSGVFTGAINQTVSNPAGPVQYVIADAYGSANTFGSASFGILKSKAAANATAQPFGVFTARSAVGFADTLTFASPSLSGQAGFFTISLIFDRALSQTGNPIDSYATAALNFGTQNASFYYQETLQLQPSGCVPSPSCSLQTTQTQNVSGGITAQWNAQSANLVALRVPMVFGQTTSISASIDMSVLARFQSTSSSWISDASQSFYWGGISAVADRFGNPIAFTANSASGTDYSRSFAPVPEPGTYLTTLIGLLLISTRVVWVKARSRL